VSDSLVFNSKKVIKKNYGDKKMCAYTLYNTYDNNKTVAAVPNGPICHLNLQTHYTVHISIIWC